MSRSNWTQQQYDQQNYDMHDLQDSDQNNERQYDHSSSYGEEGEEEIDYNQGGEDEFEYEHEHDQEGQQFNEDQGRMDTHSFEISELGESNKDKQLKKNLQKADLQMQQQLEEASEWQGKRIEAEAVKNAYYKEEIDAMKKEMKNMRDSTEQKNGGSNASLNRSQQSKRQNEQQFSQQQQQQQQQNFGSQNQSDRSTLRNEQNYQNIIRGMHDQQTNARPLDYEFDMNKNNVDLQSDILSKKKEQQQLDQLYRQADEHRQQVLAQAQYPQQGYSNQGRQQPMYLRNQENEELKREIENYRRMNDQEYQWKSNLQAEDIDIQDQGTIQAIKKQFQGQISQPLENVYLDKLLNSKEFVVSNFQSDKIASNVLKVKNLEDLVRNVKQRVGASLNQAIISKDYTSKLLLSNKLTQKQVQAVEDEGKKEIIVRGARDAMDLKLLGNRRSCKECTFLLNKGLSSQYCPSCGNYKEKKHPSKKLPKRLSGI